MLTNNWYLIYTFIIKLNAIRQLLQWYVKTKVKLFKKVILVFHNCRFERRVHVHEIPI